MAEAIISIARSIFNQKYKELLKIRNELKSKKKGNRPPINTAKLKEFEKLIAELEKNFEKANKVLKEIWQLANQ